LKSAGDVAEWHARRKADDDRPEREREECRQPHPGDEQHHKGNADGCDE